MFAVLQSIILSRILHPIEITNDYAVFWLHCKFTAGLLLAFFVIVTTEQFAGDPITCISTGNEKELIDTFCWSHSTYVIPKAFYKEVGPEVPHPGIDTTNDPREYRHLRYYQWIYVMLFFQAVLFYVPKWLWKLWEGGKIRSLTRDLVDPVLPEKELKEKRSILIKYLVRTWTAHDAYALKYILCEFLALFNTVGQMCLLDRFFGGDFLSYGYRVIRFQLYEAPKLRTNSSKYFKGDPMIMMFPRVSKCVFRLFRPTSALTLYDVLCVMAMNIINEKIYLFLWFWFILLIVLIGWSFITDLLLMFSVTVRIYTLKAHFYLVDRRDIQILMRKGHFGDWFLIDLIGRNLDNVLFKSIVEDMAKALSDNDKSP